MGSRRLRQAQKFVESTNLPQEISSFVETLRNLPEEPEDTTQVDKLHWVAALYAKWQHEDKEEPVDGSELVGCQRVNSDSKGIQ